MPSKLSVGTLSFKVCESALSALFASLSIPVAGVKVILDFETGKSRGFGFAELAPEADMAKAIRELNGKVVDGRALTVNEAKPQARRESGGFDRGRRGFGDRESRNNRERPRY